MSIEKNNKNTLVHEDGGYTTLINESIQNIKHTGALGVYCYLASKPANWEICKIHLQNHFETGKSHINTCFRFLKKCGAIEIRMIRNSKGQVIEWQTILKRKIPPPSTQNNQNTENQHSGSNAKKTNNVRTSSRIPVFQNLDKPESGKSAIINKRDFKNKRIKKNKDAVSFFSCAQDIKDHLKLVLYNRGQSISDDLTEQLLWYIGEEKDYDIVTKKINLALKLMRTKKWNIPHGYKGITSQSIKQKETLAQIQKEKEIQNDAIIGQAIKLAIKTDQKPKSLMKMWNEHRENLLSCKNNGK